MTQPQHTQKGIGLLLKNPFLIYWWEWALTHLQLSLLRSHWDGDHHLSKRWAIKLLAIFLLPAFQSMPRNDDILTLYPRASREPTKLQCFEWTDIKKRHIQFSFCCDHTIEWCLFNLFWVYLRTVNVLLCFDICFILLWKLKPKFFRQLSSFLKNPCPFLRVTKNISFQNTFLAHLIF